MGRRSRSRSPRRERRRSRSRERDRRGRRSRSRSPDFRRRRSRSPRRRSRSLERDRERRFDRRERSRSREKQKVHPSQIYQRPPLDESAFEGKSEEEIEMMKIMGFGGFDTTKGKKVPGNDVGSANITQKRRYRQYMNRRGGFNRPLDAIA